MRLMHEVQKRVRLVARIGWECALRVAKNPTHATERYSALKLVIHDLTLLALSRSASAAWRMIALKWP